MAIGGLPESRWVSLPSSGAARAEALRKLRETVMHHSQLTQCELADDKLLLRFLHAKSWDVDSAATAITSFLQSRAVRGRGARGNETRRSGNDKQEEGRRSPPTFRSLRLRNLLLRKRSRSEAEAC